MKYYKIPSNTPVWTFGGTPTDPTKIYPNGHVRHDNSPTLCCQDWYFTELDMLDKRLSVGWNSSEYYFVFVDLDPVITFFSVQKRHVTEVEL